MKKITLRAIEPEDIDLVYSWENDPLVWQQSAAHQPFSRHALTQYILDASLSDIFASRQLRLMAVDAESQATVGCIDLTGFDPYHRRAEVGMIVDPAHRGQGYGRPMVQALIDYGRSQLHLHQLHCDIAADNTACLRIYDGLGFARQGVRRDWILTPSGWQDAILFAKIIDE